MGAPNTTLLTHSESTPGSTEMQHTGAIVAGSESSSSGAHMKVAPNHTQKKAAPYGKGKKLPWLDGKGARAMSVTSTQRLDSDSETPSPAMRLAGRKTSSALFSSKRQSLSAPRLARKATVSPPERRVPSLARSSPSPVTRHRLSHTRRSIVAPKFPSPIRTPSTRRPSASHEPQKRLSIVPHHDAEAEEDHFGDIRLRADSLAPVPDHLERADTPDSFGRPDRNHLMSSTSPAVIARVQISPSHPAPGRFNNTIVGLENMVQEAVSIADETDDYHHLEEIHEIIDGARSAVHDASGGDGTRPLMANTAPLGLSSSSHSASSSSRSSPGRAKPPLPRRIHDASLQRESTSHDWALHPRGKREHSQSPTSVSASSSGEVSRSGFSTQGDRLLPPEPAQTASRDHVDFVLRPMAREQSRGRTRLRSRRIHHRHDSSERRSHSNPRRGLDETSSSSSSSDTSFDEESSPDKAYANALSARQETSHHIFSLLRRHRRQPIARNWSYARKRWTALIACLNTALLGIIVGIYAGMVPRIQYFLGDERHQVIIGNAVLYFGLAISTFIAWPLPLLHGRKPYLLAALALALPLQFPQAIVVSEKRSPTDARFKTGLLCARALTGLVLGFANVNYITVLLDLFGSSLQSKNPHQEFVVPNDVRRHGGGMGLWLGLWSWCWIASIAIGFQIGAAVIERLSPDWGFYIVVIILAFALLLNILAPETRRAAHRKSITEVFDRDENYITRRVARGECKLHISTEGPKYAFEEVWAGMKLSLMMLAQPGFAVLALYAAWIYAQIVLVIILLGALLSRDYHWQPRWVGCGVMSIAIGSFLAVPLTKAGLFSRERKSAFRTDSMTFQKQVTWSSHLVRRVLFTLALPLMGLAYTVSSAGAPKPHMVPIVFAGALGFLSVLAVTECYGVVMETFDTCDLQPGVNTRHRLESMAVQDVRRRTNYTSFPRVCAGIFASQTLAFVLAGVATLVGGSMTRHLGAQTSTGVTAAILLGLTVLLTLVLWRFKQVQVIPTHTFGTRRDTAAWEQFKDLEKMGRGSDWKPVVIGNPSGKMRRMSVLEMGSLSRWTEIRKLNYLIGGKRLGESGKRVPTVREERR